MLTKQAFVNKLRSSFAIGHTIPVFLRISTGPLIPSRPSWVSKALLAPLKSLPLVKALLARLRPNQNSEKFLIHVNSAPIKGPRKPPGGEDGRKRMYTHMEGWKEWIVGRMEGYVASSSSMPLSKN